MKQLRAAMNGTRAAIGRITSRLSSRIEILENAVASQEQRVVDMETKESPSIHTLEVAEQTRVEQKAARQNALNDSDLRVDLEQQYGTTKWARNLVNQILERRVRIP